MTETSFLLDATAISKSFKKSERLLKALRAMAEHSPQSLSSLLQECKNALARGRDIDDLIRECESNA